jgi:dienelactone hydrolase
MRPSSPVLISKTYWMGMPFWFRRPPVHADIESLVLRAHDMRQLRAHYWTSTRAEHAHARAKPRVAVVVVHPRIDFAHHYTIPRLLVAGIPVLAANTRHVGNDTFAEHEDMVLDVAACVRHLREKRGVERVVLVGNCGGGSLVAYYQAEARRAPAERTAQSPGGSPTYFAAAPMTPADGMVYLAAHPGQGKILAAAIDPSVVDEGDPLAADPALDMYAPANGFRDAPAWSAYDAAFLARFRAAQHARVERLDATARAHLARAGDAAAASTAPGFAERPEAERRDVLRRKTVEPLMVIHRTMANPAFVDNTIDPSPRDYGSLLSERPDLMNYAAFGHARVCSPKAWLSTWSGASSNADLVKNLARIDSPTLLVHAGRDREVFPADVAAMERAMAAAGAERRVVTLSDARHYFESEPGAKDAPDVERVMDVVVAWIQERFA